MRDYYLHNCRAYSKPALRSVAKSWMKTIQLCENVPLAVATKVHSNYLYIRTPLLNQ